MAYECELTSADVKAAAKRFGADLCCSEPGLGTYGDVASV